jgi:purine-cytosine permease-like protein
VPASLLIFFMIVVGVPVAGGIAVSAFQRWLQHKEKMSELIADKTA